MADSFGEWEYCVEHPNGVFTFIPVTTHEHSDETSPFLKRALALAIKDLKKYPVKSVTVTRQCYNPLAGWLEFTKATWLVSANPNSKSKYPYLAKYGKTIYGVSKDGVRSKIALSKPKR